MLQDALSSRITRHLTRSACELNFQWVSQKIPKWDGAAIISSDCPAMSCLSVENYSEKQQRSALRLLDSLDQTDSRLATHYSVKRRHSRVPYRGLATLCFPDAGAAVLSPSGGQSCTVWVRALSQSGLSFIYPEFLEETTLLFGLSAPNQDMTWFVSKVVRVREVVEEGFWEYGVKFLRRAVM